MLWLTMFALATIPLPVSFLVGQTAPKQEKAAAQQQPTVEDFHRLQRNTQRSIQKLKADQAKALKDALDDQTNKLRVAEEDSARKQAEAFKAEEDRRRAEERVQNRRATMRAHGIIVITLVAVAVSLWFVIARARRTQKNGATMNMDTAPPLIVPKEKILDGFLCIGDPDHEREEVQEYARCRGIQDGEVQYLMPFAEEGLTARASAVIKDGKAVKVRRQSQDGKWEPTVPWRQRKLGFTQSSNAVH
jgi:hypothetical protein